jgi:cytidylate kinase
MPEERLQKVLAQAGVGSRRACEELITAGRVAVDGQVVTELGVRVDPETAQIEVDGQRIRAERFRYVMLHKPIGYLSHPDPKAGYPTWQDLVKLPERLFPVGRLDVDSEGLLLLTNDGELANRLTHPRYEHPKTYLVQVVGVPNPRKIRRWQHGVMLDDGPTMPARVELLRQRPPGVGEMKPFARPGQEPPVPSRVTRWLRITLREGRKRQLRRMVALLGHPAQRVIRVGLGPLELGPLRTGKWRELSGSEVRALRVLAAHGPKDYRPDTQEETSPTERTARALLPSIIAIDGPAASGKSTIGGHLAHELDYLYFDTGVMYRAITWVALSRDVSIEDEAAVTQLAETVQLDVLSPTVDDGRDVTVLAAGEDITRDLRRPEVDRYVSPVSAYRGVRHALTLQQRRVGQGGHVVMVGRDIGTVVLPEAELKIYLDASLRERAHRRFLEYQARGRAVTEDEVAMELRRRDQIDSSRQHAPLAAASDAIMVDSTDLSIDEVMDRVHGLVERWSQTRHGRKVLVQR